MPSIRLWKGWAGRIAALAGMALVMTPVAASARPRDSDRDRMPDRWERANGLRVKAKDARRDADRDTLSNLGEYRSGTRPQKPDSDYDCIGDAREDPDRDRVDNGNELHQGTKPRDRDSDGDGIADGREDADHDGVRNAVDRIHDSAADARAQARCREARDRRKPPRGKDGGTTPPPSTPPPSTTPPPSPAGFVSRAGTQLLMNGSPYRFTGFNIYNANSVNNCWYTLGSGSALDSSLADIGAGKEAFRAWFFQKQATRDGVRDWTAFDHTLEVARSRGVKVIATLGNQWWHCEGWPTESEGYKTESWYQSGYSTLPGSPGMPATYRTWVAEIVARYRDNPTILAWQLVNEAEDKTTYGGSCSSTAPATLKAFAADMGSLVKSIDPNHLVNLGTMGSGQCGAAGSSYQDVHSVPGIDLCEYHDYALTAMPGDQWNGMARRLSQCNELGKPLFVGELGIRTSFVGTELARAGLLASKLSTQFAAGIVGALVWTWRNGVNGGSGAGYEVGPSDPALGVLGAY
jgi:mannan endo-1,4-beta-mannosidase